MRSIIEFFVRRSLFSDILTISVIGLGLMSLALIKREVFPNVSFDVLSITTIFPGATPEEVEKQITNPIEQEIKEISGIKKIQSRSVDNLSTIFITLDPDDGVMSEVKDETTDLVNQVEGFPIDSERPIIKEMKSKEQPIIEISLSSNLPELEFRKIIKDLEREIEKIKGVSKVSFRGLRDLEIKIEVDSKKLSENRLTLDDVISVIRKRNTSIPAGTVEGRNEKVVRIVADFKAIKDIENTILRANDLGRVIRVKDLATVSEGLAKSSILNYTNGLPSIGITVLKEESGDAINVVDAVRKKMEELKPRLPKEMKIAYINDNSEWVKRRLGVLTGNMKLGLGLVLILLPLMLSVRFSLIVSLGIPFAFLGTITIIHLTGGSFNMISMMGLIIVSGMLVDDAIVVTENANRLIQTENMPPKEAAIEGAVQMVAPVTASVLTTILAFLPMAFMSGIFGKFIRQIPMAVIIALLVSLFEAFIILPGHVAHWIRRERESKERMSFHRRVTARVNELWETKFVATYLKFLTFILGKRYYVASGTLVVFILTIILAAKGMRLVLFPPEGIEIFFIRTQVTTGTSLVAHHEMLSVIDEKLKLLPKTEIKDYIEMVGLSQQDPYDPNTKRGSEYAQFVVYLTPETDRTRRAHEIIEDLRTQIGDRKEFVNLTFNRVNPGPPVGRPISLSVRGKSYDQMLVAINDLKEKIKTIPGVFDITDSYVLGKEELQVFVNESQAMAAGLSALQIGQTVRGAFEGHIATSIRDVEEKTDIRVLLSANDRSKASTLESILIPNNQGNLIPFTQVATVKSGQSMAIYEHENSERELRVTADIDLKLNDSRGANALIKTWLPDFNQRHPDVHISFGGEDEDTQESLASLSRAFIAALIGIFLVLLLTFKKLLQPMLVMLTIPLGIMSVIWTFYLHGLPISFLGILGIVALAGVIVNNAIVLVDFVNEQRARGVPKLESIIGAGKMRVRPMFLTTVTTICGVLPTAYGIGGLDKFVVPIAMALGWGLLFGSFLTSIIFPAALAILDDFEDFIGRKFPKLSHFYD